MNTNPRQPDDETQGEVVAQRIAAAVSNRTPTATFEGKGYSCLETGGGRAVQGEGLVEVLPGDVIWFEPGERHWHGAAPNRMMAHLAVQRADEAGRTAAWQEHVADTDYAGGTKPGS